MHNLKDITKAVKNISKNKKLITKPNSAMKFAATLYSENYKLLVNYKSFGNRGKTIIDNNRKELFKINSSTEMHKIHSITLSNTLEKKLNIINKLGKYKKNDPTKTMRKYFNLLGYKI